MACYPGQPMDRDDGDSFPDPGQDFDEHSSLRPHSTQSTVKWLEDTYHYEDGICLPRSTIYEHYMDFCQRKQLQPVNAASFGKIIRQQFPKLTTRRLGTRGQSKYHYYGLGIRPTSPYYTEEYLKKQQNQGVSRKETETKKTHAYYATKEKPSAVLPQFPDVNLLILSDSIPRDKLHTFMVMYRAHCQRVVDSVVRANFSEVENFLLHFWQGMPTHLLLVLSSELVVDLVALCDSTLYNILTNILITSPLQNFPESLAQEVLKFCNMLREWLEEAMKGLPDALTETKFKVAESFTRSLKRQMSLMQLAQAARNTLRSEDSLLQLKADWESLDLGSAFAQTLYAMQPLNIPHEYIVMVPQFIHEFACIVEQKSTIEDFVLWMEQLIDRCIKKDHFKGEASLREVGRSFLLSWKFFTSKIVREFTLQKAPSFGTFHLLHMLIDDYIIHHLEMWMEREQQMEYGRRINSLKREHVEETAEEIQIEDQYPHLEECEDNLHATEDTGGSVDFSLPGQQHQDQNPAVDGRAFGFPAPLSGASSDLAPPTTSIPLSSPLPATSSTSSSSFIDRLQPLASLSSVCVGNDTNRLSLVTNGDTVAQSGSRVSEVVASSLPQMATLSQSAPQQLPAHVRHAPIPSFLQHCLAVPPPNINIPSGQVTMPTSSAVGTSSIITALAPLHNLHSAQPSFNFNPSHAASGTTNIPGLPPFQMPLPHSLGTGLPGQLAHTGALPLLPTMYPYSPYPGIPGVQNLPSQPIPSSIVRVSAPGFPARTLVSGYPSYMPPSAFENPPVSTGNYSA